MSKNKKNTPSLDLSFAYGTTIHKRLSEQDIKMFQAAEAAAEEGGHSEDPTIRTVTSLFSGTRGIKGLSQPDDPSDPPATDASEPEDEG